MTAVNLIETAANRVMVMDPVRQELAWREAAGMPNEVSVIDALALLDEEPKPNDVLASMVDDMESLSPEWLDESLERYQRAVQVQALRSNLEIAGRNIAGQRRALTTTARFEVSGPRMAEALEQLALVLKALPEGDATLRPEASIDAGTTEELAEARALLNRIGAMLGGLPVDGGRRLMNRWTLALIDIPQVEPARIKGHGMPALNPSPARDAIQEAAQYTNVDALVIDILRDKWQPLSLRVVTGRGELQARSERVHTAHQVVVEERR